MKKFLIIQTAFIGDVILATGLIEKLKEFYPDASIDFLVRQGNEGLLKNNPNLRHVLIWNKREGKVKNLLTLKRQIKGEKYDVVINAHRFASSGYLTAFSGAMHRIGFKKNPFSFKFTHKIDHNLKSNLHEIERNQLLIAELTDGAASLPKLYPNSIDFEKVSIYQKGEYVCMAPASVWYTKQLPKQQWLELIQRYKSSATTIYLLGGPADVLHNDYILASAFQDNVVNLAGELSFLESAALMKGAAMNYVNDSGPLHIASSVNAPTTAFFCSTIPAFGFGPLSEQQIIVENTDELPCRPCGLHGFNKCPKKHFKCGRDIDVSSIRI